MTIFYIKSGNDAAFAVRADHTLDALTKLVTFFNNWKTTDQLEYSDAVARFDENRFLHIEPRDIPDDILTDDNYFILLPDTTDIYETNVHDHHYITYD